MDFCEDFRFQCDRQKNVYIPKEIPELCSWQDCSIRLRASRVILSDLFVFSNFIVILNFNYDVITWASFNLCTVWIAAVVCIDWYLWSLQQRKQSWCRTDGCENSNFEGVRRLREHGKTPPCAPCCLWLLLWMEKNGKGFSWHVIVQIFYLQLASNFSENLIYSLEVTVLWILHFCLCPKQCGCWWCCACAGWSCLQSLLPGSQECAGGHS